MLKYKTTYIMSAFMQLLMTSVCLSLLMVLTSWLAANCCVLLTCTHLHKLKHILVPGQLVYALLALLKGRRGTWHVAAAPAPAPTSAADWMSQSQSLNCKTATTIMFAADEVRNRHCGMTHTQRCPTLSRVEGQIDKLALAWYEFWFGQNRGLSWVMAIMCSDAAWI